MADAAMLSESEAAFYSFASVMLCLYIVPSALYTAYRVLRQPKKLLQSAYFTANAVALALAVAALLKCLQLLQNVDTSGVFDPYEILKISDGASLREIKKAYRRLGRELHPDKNPGNRTAQTLFTRVTKAYEALTDAKGVENYRKFGHPDGPQSRLLDFAFSGFTGGGGNSSALFVLVYFAIIFGVIAFIVYSLHKSSGRRDRTQVSRRTAAVFLERFHEKMGVHDIVELLLSCDEMVTTAGGEADAQEAVQRSKAHDKILKKMESVKALPADILTRIKKHPDAIARENMIALYQFLRRNKLTGVPKPAWLDVRLRKVLLELPYLVDIFAALVAEHSVKRAYPSLTLTRTLALLSSIAQGSFVPDEEALRDQKARLYEGAELPRLSLSDVSMAVLDEANIQPGDWITLQLTISREHVAAGASAPLASTFYDELDPKSEFRKEHLWLLVVDKATSRLYGAAKIKSLAQSVPHKLLFEGPGISGAYELDVRVVCPAYFNVQAATSVAIEVESASKKN